MTPICPTCGSKAKLSVTKFGNRHDCCDLWSWDSAPLVDKQTHEARKASHLAFDVLWKSGGMSRSQAYQALAAKMNLTAAQCHIKLMSAEMALGVPSIAAQIASDVSAA